MEAYMKKPIIAALLALFMTVCVGAAMFAIGGAAVLNKNSVPASNWPGRTQGSTTLVSAPQTDQVAQLQSLVAQY